MQFLVTERGSVGCVFDTTPCDPQTHQRFCLDPTRVVDCATFSETDPDTGELTGKTVVGDPAIQLSYRVVTKCHNGGCGLNPDGTFGCQ